MQLPDQVVVAENFEFIVEVGYGEGRFRVVEESE